MLTTTPCFLLLLAASTLAGCTGAQAKPAAPLQLTAAQEADKAHRAKQATEFGIALYQELARKPGNVFFSPWSITDAMAMTWAATSGATQQQIQDVLRFDPATSVHDAIHHLNHQLVAERAGTTGLRLVTANRLWVTNSPDTITVAKEFETLLRDTYHAPLEQLDFAAFEDARKTINQWVAGETMDMIPELLPVGSLNALTRTVVTNAVAFEGEWASPFEESATHDRPFHLNQETSINVPTMARKGSYATFADDEVRLLALPYAGATNDQGHGTIDTIRMLLLLPGKDHSLAELELQLTGKNLDRWRTGIQAGPVSLQLPKLNLQTSNDLSKSVLPNLGMKAPFEFSQDWPGLLAKPTQEPVRISGVYHNAALRVDEEGTKAAAATAVAVLGRAAARTPPPEFHFDQPFILLIEDTATGQVLFMGRIVDPR